MYAQVEKTKENKSVANSVTQKKSGVKQGLEFVDNRLNIVAQRLVRPIQDPLQVPSQLLQGEFVTPTESIVSFVKTPGVFGHARIILEHCQNGDYQNYLIELEANGLSDKESDFSWNPSVASSGRSSGSSDISGPTRSTSASLCIPAGSEVEIIVRNIQSILPPQEAQTFIINNEQAETMLYVAESIFATVGTDYRLLVRDLDIQSMNCASFVEILAQWAGMTTISSSNALGFKTPSGLVK